jgi:uncharacterized protein YsxB (DUF464 family)
VSGHTGFGLHGSDTLCAAISAVTQAGVLGILNVCHVKATVKQDDKQGYLLLQLPSNLTKQELGKTQIVFETMYEALKDLQSGYPKFIKLEVK